MALMDIEVGLSDEERSVIDAVHKYAEKILRDARVSMVEDGCNEVLSLIGAGRL